jgi:hypothetical protein
MTAYQYLSIPKSILQWKAHTLRVEIIILDDLGSLTLKLLDGIVPIFIRSSLLE